SANGANVDTLTQGTQGQINSPQDQGNTSLASLTKVGGGTLLLGGNSSNTYQGSTFLNEGTIRADKPDLAKRPLASNALGAPIQWNTSAGGGFPQVFIGNESGGADSDVLEYGPNAGTDQVQSMLDVTVAGSGKIKMNNVFDAYSSLTTNMNTDASAEIQ